MLALNDALFTQWLPIAAAMLLTSPIVAFIFVRLHRPPGVLTFLFFLSVLFLSVVIGSEVGFRIGFLAISYSIDPPPVMLEQRPFIALFFGGIGGGIGCIFGVLLVALIEHRRNSQ